MSEHTVPDDTSYEIAIVGAGPVGLGLALELGRAGVSCALIERHLEPQPIPKGQNLTQRTMEHFARWGVERDVRAARIMPADAPTGGATAYGTLLGEYCFEWYQRARVRPYYYTDNERLPQYRTEAVLREAVAELDAVESLVGWTAESLTVGDDGVEVSSRPTVPDATAATRTVSAAYVVGCDGSRSFVRREAGLGEDVSDHDRTMALIVFRSTELNRLLDDQRDRSFFKILHPRFDGYWQFLGRVDADEQWFFHAPIAADQEGSGVESARLVHEAVGAEFAMDLDHVGTWDLRIASAASFGAGRAFVAGDAAHSHPPYGGFGINLGLEDARNLGWKLRATLAGWGGDDLLASYDAERRPVFASTARDFIQGAIEQDRAFVRRFDPNRDRPEFDAAWERMSAGAAAEIGGFEPNYEGSPIVVGPEDGQEGAEPGAVGSHTFEARPGHHLPPAVLSDGRSVDAALGSGFTLLALDADPGDVERVEAAAAGLGLPLAIVPDTFADERARYGCQLILVRPDDFVAWADDRLPPDVGGLLARTVGRGRLKPTG